MGGHIASPLSIHPVWQVMYSKCCMYVQSRMSSCTTCPLRRLFLSFFVTWRGHLSNRYYFVLLVKIGSQVFKSVLLCVAILSFLSRQDVFMFSPMNQFLKVRLNCLTYLTKVFVFKMCAFCIRCIDSSDCQTRFYQGSKHYEP